VLDYCVQLIRVLLDDYLDGDEGFLMVHHGAMVKAVVKLMVMVEVEVVVKVMVMVMVKGHHDVLINRDAHHA